MSERRAFEFYNAGPTRGDCTAAYKIRLHKEFTVKEFVDEVLKDTSEWGYIRINIGKSFFDNPKCEYRRGTLLYELPECFLPLKVLSAKGDGGWSRMDYLLTVEEKE